MYSGIIYRAYCMITGKSYIGQTKQDLNKRKSQHICSSFREIDSSYNTHFHKAIRKHGIDNFEWSVLEIIQSTTLENLQECLNSLECKYIKQFDSYYNGYNLTLGGQDAAKNSKKVTIYDKNGKVIKYCNDSKEAATYLEVSEDIIRSVCRRDKEFLYKNLQRYIIRYSDYALNSSEVRYIQTLNYSKPIIQYNSSGKKVKIFASASEAARILNVNEQNISSCCRKESKFTKINNKIYTFRFEDYILTQEEINTLIKSSNYLRKVKAIDSKTGKIIGIYKNRKIAAESLGLSADNIGKCCDGIRKSCGKINNIKIIWKYAS